MKRLFMLFAIGLFLGFMSCDDITPGLSDDFVNDQIEERAGDYWTSLTPMPFQVEGASVASIGNKVYVGLGFEFGDSKKMRIYDIDADTWTTGADAPDGYESAEGVGVAHGGKFYSVGGRSPAGGGNELLMYDPVADAWTVLPSMTCPRQGLAAVVVGNNIYAIGGRIFGGPFAGNNPTACVEKYDIDKATWTMVEKLPGPRSDLAAAVKGNKIYVFGGYDGTNILSSVMMYDPNKDKWFDGFAPIPTLRGAFYAVGMKGQTVYVIGGYDGNDPYISDDGESVGFTVEAYVVSKDKWLTGLAPMITPRAETGAASHGGKIYVIGGGQPGFGNPISACEVYKP